MHYTNFIEPTTKPFKGLINDTDRADNLGQRTQTLLSRLLEISLAASVGYTIIDFINSFNSMTAAFDIIVGLIIFWTYLLNRRGKTALATYIFLTVINMALFVYADLLPKEAGIALIYFPIMGGTMILVINQRMFIRIIFLALPVISLFLLEILNYKVLGDIKLIERSFEHDYYLNLTVATITFTVAIYYAFNVFDETILTVSSSKDKYRSLASDFEKTNQELAKTNKELDQFVYSTSHDLRAPLMSILGLVQLIEIEKDSTKILHYLNLIKSRISNMDNFIQEVTNYSRNSRIEVKKEEVSVEAIVQEVISEFKFVENVDKIHFEQNIEVDKEVLLDRFRVQIILNNLVGNAIKYHDFTKDRPEICIKAFRNNGDLQFLVKDNGTGMHESVKENVFNMFYRGSEKSNGSGLGLYIVKEVVEHLEGEIDVKSTFGHGTEFKVNLPLN